MTVNENLINKYNNLKRIQLIKTSYKQKYGNQIVKEFLIIFQIEGE